MTYATQFLHCFLTAEWQLLIIVSCLFTVCSLLKMTSAADTKMVSATASATLQTPDNGKLVQCSIIFWFKYDLNRSTTHPKFNPTGFEPMTKMLALTTEPSETIMPFLFCYT